MEKQAEPAQGAQRGADPDLVLLDQWCAGDNAAGNALFRRHYEAVYRFFASKVEGEVDDLAQETFLACVRERGRFLGHSAFRTYLFAIARYTLYGYWRKRARRGQPLDFEEVSIASLSTSIGSRMVRREDHARLLEALRQLPLEQQLLLELHYWEELEREQLAAVFEVEPATTRSRLYRARAALRQRLDVAASPEVAAPTQAAGSVGTGGEDDALDAWARSLWPAREEVRNAPQKADTKGP
jgi:RNA polymerase sigma factor (sigma-70 family)